jgi:hypothetical protein
MMEFRFQFEPPWPGELEPFLAALVFQMQQWLAQPGLPAAPPELAPELAQSFFRALAPALAQWLEPHRGLLPAPLVQQALALAGQLRDRVTVH